MTTRKEQKEQRRGEILMAGLELFVKKGFAATKISDIAKAANMSAGLMFHYFESKEALLLELVNIGLDGTKQAMWGDPNDPLDFFTKAAQGIFEYILKNKQIAYMFVLMERTQTDESVPESIREIAKAVDNVERCVPVIELGQKMGQIREGNPLALSTAFWGAIQSLMVTLSGYCDDGERMDAMMPEAEWFVDIIRKK